MTTSRIPIDKKIILINTISKFSSHAINVSVLVWLQQYLLARISADEYALFPFVMSIMGFVPILSIILTSGIGRYITIAYAKGDDAEITRIVSTMLPILTITGLVILILGWSFAWHIDFFFPILPEKLWDARFMLGLLMLLSAAQLPAAAYGAGFAVRQKLYLQDFIILFCQILNNILLLLLILGLNARVVWVVVALTASQFVQLLITIPVSRYLCPAQKFRINSFHLTLAKEISAFGGWNFLGRIVRVVKESLDPLILVKFASAIDVATFHVGGMPFRQIERLAAPLFLPLFPILGSLEASGQITRMRSIYYRYSRYCIWLIFLPTLPLMVFAKEIIYLYIGDKYIEAYIVVRILLIAMMLNMLTILSPAIAIARGLVKGMSLRESCFMALNIILTIIFVVFMKKGAVGSAMATLLSMLAVYPILIIPFSIYLVDGTFKEFVSEIFLPGVSPFFISFIILFIIKNHLALNNWLSIAYWSIIGGSIYMIFLLLFCLKKQDIDEIKNLIDKFKIKLKRGSST